MIPTEPARWIAAPHRMHRRRCTHRTEAGQRTRI